MSEPVQREWHFYIDDMIGFCRKVLAYTQGLDAATFPASGGIIIAVEADQRDRAISLPLHEWVRLVEEPAQRSLSERLVIMAPLTSFKTASFGTLASQCSSYQNERSSDFESAMLNALCWLPHVNTVDGRPTEDVTGWPTADESDDIAG